jgi:hypothetical protein
MLWLERLAEEKIREAMERGEFDDLPLEGRPLRFESNGFVPEDLRLAYKLLKDAGFLPPEMELRKEIVTLKELLAEVEGDDERLRLARRINEKVLRLNLLHRRSFERADCEVYVTKLRRKLGATGS